MKYLVNLNKVNSINKFVEDISKYEFDIDIIKGSYIIDAKSLMGIFTLDLSEDVTIEIHSDDKNVITKFEEDIKDIRK